MLISRSKPLFQLLKNARTNPVGQLSKRNSHDAHWSYRGYDWLSPPKRETVGATALGALMWWWIIWHVITEPGHIVGEFTYPDPSKWTDEELGIPPDDEGPYEG